MVFLRQGATHKVVIGPAVAVGDGFTPVTTLDVSTADEAEAILHDNGTVVDISGYTFAAITTADGYYHLTLQSGISGTVGHLTIVINDDSLILPLRSEFTVIEEAAYDALFAASADPKADINVGSIDAGAITAAAIATGAIDADAIADGAIDAGAFAADAITAAKLAADVTTELQSGLATAAALTTVDTVVDAIKVQTDKLTFTVANQVDSNMLAVDGSTDAAARLERAAETEVLGTVGSGSTTTSIVASALAPTSAVNDQFNGRIIIFDMNTTTTALRGQATDITDYVHATLTFTVTALTTAAVSGDTFVIV